MNHVRSIGVRLSRSWATIPIGSPPTVTSAKWSVEHFEEACAAASQVNCVNSFIGRDSLCSLSVDDNWSRPLDTRSRWLNWLIS
ncbi:MAG: hypothetical protein R3C56_24425 [Pirellulaceae bacterium]